MWFARAVVIRAIGEATPTSDTGEENRMLESQGAHMLASVVYALIGVVTFAIAFVVMEKVAPFSLRKELAEDDNIAVGIVLGAVVIGLSIIIASAIGS